MTVTETKNNNETMSEKKIIISPSLLSCDFARLKDEIEAVEKAGADWLHVDVMDGHFVNNLTIGPPIVAAIKKYCTVPLDVHLMISEPLRYVERFVEAGSDIITFHIEADFNPGGVIDMINKAAARLDRHVNVGISLNPDTPAHALHEVIGLIDMVLVMTVYPGFGGQSFIERAIDKITDVISLSPEVDIQVDGGITPENIHVPALKGANAFVAGTAVFKSPDYAAAIAALRRNAKKSYRRGLAG